MQTVIEGFYNREFSLPDRIPKIAAALQNFYHGSTIEFSETKDGQLQLVRAAKDGIRTVIAPNSTRFIMAVGVEDVDPSKMEPHIAFFRREIFPEIKAKRIEFVGTRATLMFNPANPKVNNFDRSRVFPEKMQGLLNVQNQKIKHFRIEFVDDSQSGPATTAELALKDIGLEIPSKNFNGTKSIKFRGAVLDIIKPYKVHKLDSQLLQETLDTSHRIYRELFEDA